MPDAFYEDMSAYALRLQLYDGFVDRSDFSIFARGRARAGATEVAAAVIGSSHWMEVRMARVALTEMLACRFAPKGEPLAVWRPGESAVELTVKDGARYRFEAQVVPLQEAAAELCRLRELIGFTALVPSEIGLKFEFPPPEGGSGAAETLVWAAATARGVKARTAHCYPSEELVVLSSTQVRLAAATQPLAERELVASA